MICSIYNLGFVTKMTAILEYEAIVLLHWKMHFRISEIQVHGLSQLAIWHSSGRRVSGIQMYAAKRMCSWVSVQSSRRLLVHDRSGVSTQFREARFRHRIHGVFMKSDSAYTDLVANNVLPPPIEQLVYGFVLDSTVRCRYLVWI